MTENILEMKDISKTFSGVKVLDHAQLTVKKGQVHALMGENGAGKSTLMKILSGAYTKEDGTIVFDGEELPQLTPGQLIKKGISVIYQEFNLLPDMPVYENIFLGKEYVKNGRLDIRREIKEAEEYMAMVGLVDDPRTHVSELSVAKKQMVEIAKAISNDVKLLILDEPTAAITDNEIKMLFKIISALREKGVGIIYISHRMSEIFEICDACTVMRDGKYIKTLETSQTSLDELTRLMVGRSVNCEKLSNTSADFSQKVLSVKNLSCSSKVKDVSFDLHKGEILGISGLVGSGRTETALAIMGVLKKSSGTVTFKGSKLGSDVSANIKKGIVYLSEDRKDEGLILMHSVRDNISAANFDRLCNPFYSPKKADAVSRKYIDRLKIKTRSEKTEVSKLSGGNQQKVVIAKWLYYDSEVYIFDEPTRGIDVGARDDIYSIMHELVKNGASIIMISSDITEILKMSDRIAVMSEGRIQAVLENDGNVSQHDILKTELVEVS